MLVTVVVQSKHGTITTVFTARSTVMMIMMMRMMMIIMVSS